MVNDNNQLTDCWIYAGTTDPRGYPLLSHKVNGKKMVTMIHRAMYIETHGPIPSGMNIYHLCNVTTCINPSHVICGTSEHEWMAIRGIPKTYSSIHARIIHNYGNAPLCIWDESHTARLEWANVSGNYTVNLEDYLPMCASCHRKFDMTEEMRRKVGLRSMGNTYSPRVPIYQLNQKGNIMNKFESVRDAERKTGISHSNISGCLVGKRKSAGSYKWRRVGED